MNKKKPNNEEQQPEPTTNNYFAMASAEAEAHFKFLNEKRAKKAARKAWWRDTGWPRVGFGAFGLVVVFMVGSLIYSIYDTVRQAEDKRIQRLLADELKDRPQLVIQHDDSNWRPEINQSSNSLYSALDARLTKLEPKKPEPSPAWPIQWYTNGLIYSTNVIEWQTAPIPVGGSHPRW